jgi:hypothetical protein
VTIRYFDGCPNWRTALEPIEEVSADLGVSNIATSLERVESSEKAERLRFVGSPTLLLDGRDPFEEETAGSFGLSCRIYATPEGPAGSPTTDQLREVLAAYLDGEATS